MSTDLFAWDIKNKKIKTVIGNCRESCEGTGGTEKEQVKPGDTTDPVTRSLTGATVTQVWRRINPLSATMHSKDKGKGHPWQMQQESRGGGRNLVILNLGTRWRWTVNATPRPLYPCKRTSVHVNLCRSFHAYIAERAGRASSPVWTCMKQTCCPHRGSNSAL